MAKAYSIDLRQKIIESYENKEGSMRKLAKRFKVSGKFVFTLIKRFNETGSIKSRYCNNGRKPAINAEGENFIRELLEEQSDLIVKEICVEYNNNFEQTVTRSTIDRTLKRMNITRKHYLTEEKIPLKAKLTFYQNDIISFEPEQFIFIDEMGVNANITRTYARSEKGTRARCENPIKPVARISTVGALGINGLLAEMCYQGTMNAIVFKTFIEHILVPVLRPNNIVILDNATVHYDEDAIAMIETTGAGFMYLLFS